MVNFQSAPTISLPAGVFQPYSGVKTSVLILDKSLAKHSDNVAFFKVENDGFSLGAQRRAQTGEELSQVKRELAEFLTAIGNQQSVAELKHELGLIVQKEKVAANGEYNLSGERYREGVQKTNIFPLVNISTVCTVNPRKSLLTHITPDMFVSFVPMADINEYQMTFIPNQVKLFSEISSSYTYFEDNDVLLAKVTPCFENGKAGIARELSNGVGFGSSEFYVLRSNEKVLPEWIYFCVLHSNFRDNAIAQMTGTGGLQRVPRDYVENFQIPLPPLEMQKEIVAEIEGYQKVINGARAVLDNYRPHIAIHPDWPVVELGEVCDIKTGKLNSNAAVINGVYPFFTCSKDVFQIDSYAFDCEAILLSGNNASGNFDVKHYCGKFNAYQRTYVITVKSGFLDKMTYGILKYILDANLLDLKKKSIGGLTQYLTLGMITSINLPLPPFATQQDIVAEIEAEQALVAANRELITRFEKKIQATLARVWGEESVQEKSS